MRKLCLNLKGFEKKQLYSWIVAISLMAIMSFSCGGGGGGSTSEKSGPHPFNASGTWKLSETKTYDSENAGSVGEVDQSIIEITETSNIITIVTEEGDKLSGKISGSIYEFYGDLGQAEDPNGNMGTVTINGTFELRSETSLYGDYTVIWTDGVNEHTEMWDFTGAKQIQPIGCGEGLPLSFTALNFPMTVVAGSTYDGTVAYQGSFEDIANPLMMGRITFTGGFVTFLNYSPPTTNNCILTFKAMIPNDLSGTGPIYFRLVDFDEEIDFLDNWEDTVVSNEISQTITIR
jgi:hypothetical protein